MYGSSKSQLKQVLWWVGTIVAITVLIGAGLWWWDVYYAPPLHHGLH